VVGVRAWGVASRAYKEPQKNLRPDMERKVAAKGVGWRQQTSSIPGEPDVLDDGDVVEGLGIDSWRRVRRVEWWFVAVVTVRITGGG